jgi:hypothetical protein
MNETFFEFNSKIEDKSYFSASIDYLFLFIKWQLCYMAMVL